MTIIERSRHREWRVIVPKSRGYQAQELCIQATFTDDGRLSSVHLPNWVGDINGLTALKEVMQVFGEILRVANGDLNGVSESPGGESKPSGTGPSGGD